MRAASLFILGIVGVTLRPSGISAQGQFAADNREANSKRIVEVFKENRAATSRFLLKGMYICPIDVYEVCNFSGCHKEKLEGKSDFRKIRLDLVHSEIAVVGTSLAPSTVPVTTSSKIEDFSIVYHADLGSTMYVMNVNPLGGNAFSFTISGNETQYFAGTCQPN